MPQSPLQTIRISLAVLACCTWLLPVHGVAATKTEMSSTAQRIRDVALDGQGRITGQFVDAQGRPRAQQLVTINRPGNQPLQTRTDDQGRFVLAGLSSGTYQIATSDAAMVCRCWTENSAPPVATRELLIVSGEGIQRGQRPIGEMLFSAPVLVGLVIVAAIAIPVAIHNSQDAS